MATFDVSTLVAYIEENRADFALKAITGSKIMDFVDIREGIKSSEKLPDLETTVPAYASTSCVVNASGTTNITQTSIATSPIAVSPEWCLMELEADYTQKYLKKGAGKLDTLDFFQTIMDRTAARIAQKSGMMITQGKTTYTNDTWLKQINGFISTIDTAGTQVQATTQASVSTSTVRGIVEEIIFQKIPSAAFQKNPFLLMSMEDFRILLQKLWVDNLYNFMPTNSEFTGYQLTYPGTNVTIYGVPDLNADNPVDTGSLATAAKHRMICTYKENLIFGCDSKTDFEDFDIWFDKNTRKIKSYMRMRAGVAVRYMDHVVTYQNT